MNRSSKTADINSSSKSANRRPWWFHPEIAALVMLVAGIYLPRLTALNARGEETRWGRGAAEMIETGDWFVPRQQGEVFPDRPPLGSWLMALTGLVRGKVDLVAIRLPSVLALMATAILLYTYCTTFLSRVGSLAAAAGYVTMGQVLQICRLGENEAVYALLLSGSLLAWHRAYRSGWRPMGLWAMGYALVGLATLQKGVQAPVYFGAATVAYLVVQRDWRTLFSLGHLAGFATWLAVVCAWFVPFGMATNWEYPATIWINTVQHRYIHGNLLEHLATFPFETLACLLPWSGILAVVLKPSIRKQLVAGDPPPNSQRGRAFWGVPDEVWFVLVVATVTYPTVWAAALGKTRYVLPLYPCFAVLMSWLIERCALAAKGTAARQAWDRFLVVGAVLIAGGGLGLLGASLAPLEVLARVAQPPMFALLFAVASVATAVCLVWLHRNPRPVAAQAAILVLAGFLGLAYTGPVTNSALRAANHLQVAVDDLKQQLPPSASLVSFGPVQHRFIFCYGQSIPMMDWPLEAEDLPDDVTYFCYDLHAGDTAEIRSSGQGWNWTKTPGTLPFEWEELAVLPVQPKGNTLDRERVVVGRVIRPLVARHVDFKLPVRK